jgi:hypothetical protein
MMVIEPNCNKQLKVYLNRQIEVSINKFTMENNLLGGTIGNKF